MHLATDGIEVDITNKSVKKPSVEDSIEFFALQKNKLSLKKNQIVYLHDIYFGVYSMNFQYFCQ